MIFLESSSFFYVVAFILIYNGVWFVSTSKLVLNLLLLLGSIIVLTTVSDIQSIGILLLVSSLVFFAGKFLSKSKKNNNFYLFIFIAILILLFIIKNYRIVDLSLVNRVGLSYILFRLIHFLVDSNRKQIHEYDMLTFCNYIIFFPTFIAGPIDEYNNFNYWIKQKRDSYKVILVKAGIFRLMLGIVKKFFLVPLIINYSLDFSLFEGKFIWQEGLLISLLLYSFYILFDFSGYSDIAIGTAYLIGIRTPENFNNPYLSPNLSVFWKRWHMTFSNFLFKYVFKPLATNLSQQFRKFPRLSITFVSYLLTFLICGLWHGNTINFVYWGMWHGFGLMLFKLWDIYVYKKHIVNIKYALFQKIYKWGAIVITFLFVTAGWFFFNYLSQDIAMIATNARDFKSENVKVSTAIFKKKPCFKIKYTGADNNADAIDIEYESTASDSTFKYYNIPVSKDSTYYLLAEGKSKNLSRIRIRNHDAKENDWHSLLVYPNSQNFEPSELQKFIFGKNAAVEALPDTFKGVIKRELFLSDEYLNQKIKTFAEFIPDYGWAIRISYLPLAEHNVKVEYKEEQGDWKTYQKRREGKYDFAHIHGDETFEQTNRNLKPGKYQVRIKYVKGAKSSRWFNSEITIPDYVHN